MRRSLPWLLIALLGVAQVALAWHAPSHLPHFSTKAPLHSAFQDCPFGVNSHGTAAVSAAIDVAAERPLCITDTVSESPLFTFSSVQPPARGPPLSR